jgi:hypothetical protein
MASIVESPTFTRAYNDFRRGKTNLALGPREAILFHYRSLKRQELGQILKGRLWVGPDIPAAASFTIPPDQRVLVPITLPGKSFPFANFDHPYFFSVFETHTRSRFAQLGLEVSPSTGPMIGQTLHLAQEGDLQEPRAIIPVVNHAARPICLPEGTKFFNLYYWDGETITGDSLIDLLGKEIEISGTQGKDWRFWYGQRAEGGPLKRERFSGNEIEGIEFFLDLQSQAWIPPSEKPISISDAEAENHNRAEVDQFLEKPIPKSDQPILWISATSASLKISEAIHGLLDWVVTETGNPVATEDSCHYQINSRIIKGGHTYGKMRTEIFSPTTEEVIPRTVLLRFVRA